MQDKKIAKKAIALQESDTSAPVVVAKGDQLLADEIIRLAHENDIPVYEDPGLTQALAQIDLGEEIPELLYRAVAEVIAFIYHLEKNQKQNNMLHKDVLTRRDMLQNKYKL